MANDTTSNPWILGTAAVITTDLQCRIDSIEWEGAAGGDQATIEDADGRIVFDATSVAGERVERQPRARSFTGLEVATLTGGTLYVHLA